MSILTFLLLVILALIFGLLLVMILIAFSHPTVENWLPSGAGLLDLYQCWQQVSPHPPRTLPEQNAKSMEQHNGSDVRRAALIYDTPQILSAPQQQAAWWQPRLSTPERMGELY